MLKKNQVDLQKSLNDALMQWWDNEVNGEGVGGNDIPYIGDDTIEIMSTAALQVLLGIINTQEYLRNERLFVDG